MYFLITGKKPYDYEENEHLLEQLIKKGEFNKTNL